MQPAALLRGTGYEVDDRGRPFERRVVAVAGGGVVGEQLAYGRPVLPVDRRRVPVQRLADPVEVEQLLHRQVSGSAVMLKRGCRCVVSLNRRSFQRVEVRTSCAIAALSDALNGYGSVPTASPIV
jgi:hypothetical protein